MIKHPFQLTRNSTEWMAEAMSGEVDLSRLIAEARPVLDPKTYVFITTRAARLVDDPAVVAMVREGEGLTLIAEQGWSGAEGLPATFPCRRITLTVHSSLEAVGLMAAVSGALAAAGISANPVAGYHHDHLFVPVADAERALAILQDLAGEGHPNGR